MSGVGGGRGGQKSVVYQNFAPTQKNNDNNNYIWKLYTLGNNNF